VPNLRRSPQNKPGSAASHTRTRLRRLRILSVDELVERQPWEGLIAALERAGCEPGRTIQQLKLYARLLVTWNRTVSNLISRNDEARLVERHLLECIEPAYWLKASGASRWLDFGSGAGLPAIPLALAGVGPDWTLVESRRAKTLFLRKTLPEIGLRSIVVAHSRLEQLVEVSDFEAKHDGFVSRATMHLGPTLNLARHLVAPGGSAFLWKGSGGEQEMLDDSLWKEFWRAPETVAVGTGPMVVARFIRTSM